jgi:hypothetical protein
MRIIGLDVINQSLNGLRILAQVDRLPLSMGIYGTTYNRLLLESWTTIDSKYGFKSILTTDCSENSLGHSNRLNKFGAYPIDEREITYEVMQRNGRAKSQTAQTGRWTFATPSGAPVTIARGGLYAVANRLDITQPDSTPDSAVPYFTSKDFGPYTANVQCEARFGRTIAWGTGMLGVNRRVEFVFGEALLGQIPIFTGIAATDTVGPPSTGYDPESGSIIGVQLLDHLSESGKPLGMNLNRTCITKSLPNPAVGRDVKLQAKSGKDSAKKSRRISFEQLQHHDDNIVGINWASIGQTFLNVAKDVAKFVVTVLPAARYKHWHQEPAPDTATVVSTGMPYLVDSDYTGPFTVNGDIDRAILNFALVHTAYSIPMNPDKQSDGQLSVARDPDNEVKASDPRVKNARMIQISISGTVYTQKLLGVPRERLNYMSTITHEQPEPFQERGYDPNAPDINSSVSDQSMFIVDNYNTITSNITDVRGGYMYGDDNDPQPAPYEPIKPIIDLKARSIEKESSDEESVNFGGGQKLRGFHLNPLTRRTKWYYTSTPVVVHSGYPFHPVNNPAEFGTPLTQFTQYRATNSGDVNPQFISPNSSGQVRLVVQLANGEIAQEHIEVGVLALLQANVGLNLEGTVPMPKSFYDRDGVEHLYGGEFPTIYFAVILNTELRLGCDVGSFQVTDVYDSSNAKTADIGGISPVAVLMTSHIDPGLLFLDTIPEHGPTVKLAFPCAKYGGGPYKSGLRVAHIVDEMGYVKELGVVGVGDNHDWEYDGRKAGTAHGVAEFATSVALVSGEDSALPATLDDD